MLRLASQGIVSDAFDRPALFDLIQAAGLVAESEGIARQTSVDPHERIGQ